MSSSTSIHRLGITLFSPLTFAKSLAPSQHNPENEKKPVLRVHHRCMPATEAPQSCPHHPPFFCPSPSFGERFSPRGKRWPVWPVTPCPLVLCAVSHIPLSDQLRCETLNGHVDRVSWRAPQAREIETWEGSNSATPRNPLPRVAIPFPAYRRHPQLCTLQGGADTDSQIGGK